MNDDTRRNFLLATASAGLFAFSCTKSGQADPRAPDPESLAEEVAPPEDLMREHGVLNRIQLVYDDCARRLDSKEPFAVDALAKSADIIRRFVEEYHEKLEENFLFPRFEKANKLVDLVATLRRQHQAGRTLTDAILRLSTAESLQSEEDRRTLAQTLRSFTRMYRPHEAREDTVLFPAFRGVVSPKEFQDLGEQFEDEEHRLFGKEGFEGIVVQVAAIEQTLGIFELDQFTPKT